MISHVLVSVADSKVMAVRPYNKECYEVNIIFNSNYKSALQLHVLNSQYCIEIYVLDDTRGWMENIYLYL